MIIIIIIYNGIDTLKIVCTSNEISDRVTPSSVQLPRQCLHFKINKT